MVGFDSSAPGEDKIEIRARTWKSLNKVLQVMEEKNKKCEKGVCEILEERLWSGDEL